MVCAVKGYPSGWAYPRLELIDQTVPVDGADATLAGALQVAATAPEGTTLLCMLPDTGERYLSTPLLDGIGADMSDEELRISRSTPGARFDSPAPSPAPAAYAIPAKPESASAAIQVSVDVENFVAQVVRAGRHPLQMDRPRLDGLPGGRPRRADSRPAARASAARLSRKCSSAGNTSAAAPTSWMRSRTVASRICWHVMALRSTTMPASTRTACCPGGCKRAETIHPAVGFQPAHLIAINRRRSSCPRGTYRY